MVEFFRMNFADLMNSGTLTCQSRISISTNEQDFSSIIERLCQTFRLTGSSSNLLIEHAMFVLSF